MTRYEALTVVQVTNDDSELSSGSGNGREWADLRDVLEVIGQDLSVMSSARCPMPSIPLSGPFDFTAVASSCG